MSRDGRCVFPLCECELGADHQCSPPRLRPQYEFVVDPSGDCAILDRDGCSVGIVHSTATAQQVVDELNNMETA